LSPARPTVILVNAPIATESRAIMYRSIIASFALTGLSAGPAFSQTDLEPGLWSYSATYSLGPIPMHDSGNYCVDRDMAETPFQGLFNNINRNCAIASSSYQDDGFHFTLRCEGGPDGELGGVLRVEGDDAQLSANGWTGTARENVPVLLSATARRIAGSCSG
jgi:hypothetical protein